MPLLNKTVEKILNVLLDHPNVGYSKKELAEAAGISKLARRNKIGMDYIPIEKTVSKIPVHARGDIIDEMYKSGLLEYHKNKDCISLNPKSVNRVIGIIEGEVPDYIIEKLK
ncbi:hypothetical protein AKJ51_04095 [candidate division MSBL1 archaeon SCGC-AAA382A20]|uniref:Uncharacterized protein n=1 Tax=candidate division MSBL1 archaeon SCGC-AAA382A20 TaxID=1698280 RepID=A0A133VIC5_9EURY|nr:hypothetical protein AKJ51_04095 [candidate division MSBL1 archaeon SCGC-AAA382A20]